MKKLQWDADFYRFDKQSVFWVLVATIIYLLIINLLTGYRPDHLSFLLFYLVAYFAHPLSRKLVLGFSIFFVYGIIFDAMKGFPNYWFSDVHIEDPYYAEKALFGITSADGIITPNEYFLVYNSDFLDVLTGIFYLSWMPIPLLFGLYLWIKDKRLFIHFSAAFFTVNVLGWIIYYAYPAAPPWYVEMHGFTVNFDTPGNVAGLIKFDEYFGITVFQDLYSKGSNVFAAMPSLHSAYPVIVFFYGIKKQVHWIVLTYFGILVIGIWFAAVYSSHHYIIDVALGASCAVLGIYIFERFLLKSKANVLFERLIAKI